VTMLEAERVQRGAEPTLRGRKQVRYGTRNLTRQ